MTESAALVTQRRLRRIVFGTAALIFAVSPVELALQEHDEGIQRLAFVACALGLAGTWLAARQPAGPAVRHGASVLLGIVAFVGLLGLWEHFEHNWAFAREIRPNLSAGAAALEALFGASPPLAPGILCLAAALPLLARRA